LIQVKTLQLAWQSGQALPAPAILIEIKARPRSAPESYARKLHSAARGKNVGYGIQREDTKRGSVGDERAL